MKNTLGVIILMVYFLIIVIFADQQFMGGKGLALIPVAFGVMHGLLVSYLIDRK